MTVCRFNQVVRQMSYSRGKSSCSAGRWSRFAASGALGFGIILALGTGSLSAKPSADDDWQTVTASDGSTPSARHEAGAVVVKGKIFLFGGRGRGAGTRPVDRFDPATGKWERVSQSPLELHHFQPVALDSKVYLLGAFTCCYPEEATVAAVHVFDTDNNTWSTEGNMPAARLRGATGAVVRNQKIYVLGGNTNGHSGGAVGWFDEFDPRTGDWRSLPDAPHSRDHFQAVLIGDRLVATAGRTTIYPQVFRNAVAATDVYDFNTGNWSTRANIPTLRAGAISVGTGSEVLVAGGEISGAPDNKALRDVEAFDVDTGTWRTLQPLIQGRHSGGGVVLGDDMHMMAGSLKVGGAPETSSHEMLSLTGGVDDDRDDDGLSNQVEIQTHETDPDDADTDDDGLDDGEEIALGSNPKSADTDSDGLADGSEVNTHGTSPLLADSDSDNVSDAIELAEGTNPNSADSDSDGLDDGEERQLETDPLKVDTDSDGLSDGDEVNTHSSNPLLADSDNDGLDDRQEVEDYGTRPDDADSDEDGLDDSQEIEIGTNPLDKDSDADGIEDGVEVEAGSDPLKVEVIDEGSKPDNEVDEGSTPDEAIAQPSSESGGGIPGPMQLLMLLLLACFRSAKSNTR